MRTGFAEQASGRCASGREQLSLAIDFAREGDTLIVMRLDRLARSVADLHHIVERLASKKVAFKCLNQAGVDTDTSSGRLMLAMLGAIAAFENDIRLERQREGIARAKAQGKYRGRPVTIGTAQIRQLRTQGKGASEIARELNIGRASVYRSLAARFSN